MVDDVAYLSEKKNIYPLFPRRRRGASCDGLTQGSNERIGDFDAFFSGPGRRALQTRSIDGSYVTIPSFPALHDLPLCVGFFSSMGHRKFRWRPTAFSRATRSLQIPHSTQRIISFGRSKLMLKWRRVQDLDFHPDECFRFLFAHRKTSKASIP